MDMAVGYCHNVEDGKKLKHKLGRQLYANLFCIILIL